MDHPSGVTEHDKAVELIERIKAFGTCNDAYLDQLVEDVKDRFGKIRTRSAEDDPVVLLAVFLGKVVACPTRKVVEQNQCLMTRAQKAPSFRYELADEYIALAIDALIRRQQYNRKTHGSSETSAKINGALEELRRISLVAA